MENLADQLIDLKSQNKFKGEIVLFVRKEDLTTIRKKYGSQVNYKIADFPHYSFKEQIFLPKVINETGCNLVHFPHFNIPFFYQAPFVVTIHDLTKHSFGGQKATTRFLPFYYLKYLAYKMIIRQAVKKAAIIFTPSNFVKNQLAKQYKVDPSKIIVTYEGVGEKFSSISRITTDQERQKEILSLYQIRKPYLLYVGNLYPHKNIPLLIEAVKRARQKIPALNLVIVCGRNVFWERLKKTIKASQSENFVRLTGFVPDEDLPVIYNLATIYCQPSFAEGFGLPLVQAMQSGCPVAFSRDTSLPEVVGEAGLSFNPRSIPDIASVLKKYWLNPKLRHQYRQLGLNRAKLFKWSDTAKQTLAVYQSLLAHEK